MVDIYQIIAPQLETTYIYNGDTDPCVSYEGTQLAIKQVGLGIRCIDRARNIDNPNDGIPALVM